MVTELAIRPALLGQHSTSLARREGRGRRRREGGGGGGRRERGGE